jgi:hypothetical protein
MGRWGQVIGRSMNPCYTTHACRWWFGVMDSCILMMIEWNDQSTYTSFSHLLLWFIKGWGRAVVMEWSCGKRWNGHDVTYVILDCMHEAAYDIYKHSVKMLMKELLLVFSSPLQKDQSFLHAGFESHSILFYCTFTRTSIFTNRSCHFWVGMLNMIYLKVIFKGSWALFEGNKWPLIAWVMNKAVVSLTPCKGGRDAWFSFSAQKENAGQEKLYIPLLAASKQTNKSE